MEKGIFQFTSDGYIKSKAYLKEIGEWEYISTHGFSTDGWSIISVANLKHKNQSHILPPP